MVVVVIMMLLVILLLVIDYFNDKLKKKDEEIKNLVSNIEILKQHKDDCENKLFTIEYTNKIKKLSEKNINSLPMYKPNKKLKVLVADYIVSSATITNSILESMGFETTIASSAENALSELKSNLDYDIVITNNVFNGKLQGKDLLYNIKEIENFNIPVIVLTTTYNEREYFINELGFDEYMMKPLNTDQVKKSVCKVISNLVFRKIKSNKK